MNTLNPSFGSRYVCASCRARLGGSLTGQASQSRRIHLGTLRKRQEAKDLWKIKADAQKNGEMPTMLKFLEDRGYVERVAGDRDHAEKIMRDERLGVYVGLDPTARSLHIGHLIPLMALFQMYAHGYHTYTLLGGVTAAIGDPSGRTASREYNKIDRRFNTAAMHLQLKRMWANVDSHLQRRLVNFDVGSKRGLLNNSFWLNKLPVSDFLRLMGKNVSLKTMLDRDMYKSRMTEDKGPTFAEFAYPLVQGWDWWHMYKALNVKMQIGGADQLGNIEAGKEALFKIAKEDVIESKLDDVSNATPIGLTTPLFEAGGQVMGKTGGKNTVWLDPEMTSVGDQFGFFLQTNDADVERYLKLFTFLDDSEIAALREEDARDPTKRAGAAKLAEEVCSALHGRRLSKQAMVEHGLLQASDVPALRDPNDVEWEKMDKYGRHVMINPAANKFAAQTNATSGFEHCITLPEHRIKEGTFPALFFWSSLVGSRNEGNRLIKTGGAYVGHKKSRSDMQDELSYVKVQAGQLKGSPWEYVMDGKLLVLRVGKWKTRLVTVVSDDEWARGLKDAAAVEEAQARAQAQAQSGAKAVSSKNPTWKGDGRAETKPETKAGPEAEAEAEEGDQESQGVHMDPARWLALDRRMVDDDKRWEEEVGEKRRAESERKRQAKLLQQQLTLQDHAHALNPQRKGGKRAKHPKEGTKATLVRDWDKKLVW